MMIPLFGLQLILGKTQTSSGAGLRTLTELRFKIAFRAKNRNVADCHRKQLSDEERTTVCQRIAVEKRPNDNNLFTSTDSLFTSMSGCNFLLA